MGLSGVETILLLVALCSIGVELVPIENGELVQVHAIFRHGQRTTYRFYPTDPYRNETFYPIGLGGLTNKGKMMEYQLGKYLRKLYGSFLGDTYAEELMEIHSTNTLRTRMSALLVLAGLWPPKRDQVWNSELPWMPVPVDYKSREDIISPSDCAMRSHLLDDLPNRSEVQEIFIHPYKELFNYIETHSGMPINEPHDLLEFFFIINTEDEMGLDLPEWTSEVYPEPLTSVVSHVYEYLNFDSKLRKINIGYLLNKIIKDTVRKISDEPNNEKKIVLYSGHETTLGYFLEALKLTEAHIPPYSSAVLVEVHKLGDQYFFKLRYKKGTDSSELQDLILPGCEIFCPVERFIGLVQHLLPELPFKEACALKF